MTFSDIFKSSFLESVTEFSAIDTLIGMLFALVIGLFIFVIGARCGWNALLIALGYGVFIGGLWSVSDTMILVMTGESTPTELRASVYGANGMISGIGMLIGIVVMVLGINLVGSGNVGLLSLITTLPFILLAMVLLMKNVRETNGQDLNDIGEM